MTKSISNADKPITLGAIKNHVIIVCVGFFVLSILTSLVSVNAFVWDAKNDLKDYKETKIEFGKMKESIEGMNLTIEKNQTVPALNSQSIMYIKQSVDDLKKGAELRDEKIDKMYEILIHLKK
jgi:hypothetical protein